ncbi:hypothetical protein Tco_1341066 [Tanacetum coccineum]
MKGMDMRPRKGRCSGSVKTQSINKFKDTVLCTSDHHFVGPSWLAMKMGQIGLAFEVELVGLVEEWKVMWRWELFGLKRLDWELVQ